MIMSRAKAIRKKCLDCCCGQQVEVRLCTAVECPLFPYRMGRVKRVDKNADESEEE